MNGKIPILTMKNEASGICFLRSFLCTCSMRLKSRNFRNSSNTQPIFSHPVFGYDRHIHHTYSKVQVVGLVPVHHVLCFFHYSLERYSMVSGTWYL